KPAGWRTSTPPPCAAGPPAGSSSSPAAPLTRLPGAFLSRQPAPPGVLRTVHFAACESDEGLDVAQPLVVEGELVVIRHRARGEFPAVVELQVREARRVR